MKWVTEHGHHKLMKHGKEIARYTVMKDYESAYNVKDMCYVYVYEVTPMSFKVPVDCIDNVRKLLEILAGRFGIEPGDIVKAIYKNGQATRLNEQVQNQT